MHFFAFFFASQGGGLFFASFAFFLHFFHLSCLQFPCIVAIHGQVCVTCTILTGGGRNANAFICIFCSLDLHPPPPWLRVGGVAVGDPLLVAANNKPRRLFTLDGCKCWGPQIGILG